MNTRRRDSGPMAQEAFASSVEHDRGLLCNLVATRAQCCRSERERAALWFVQAMSWKEGGLDGFAERSAATFPDHPLLITDPSKDESYWDPTAELLGEDPPKRVPPKIRKTTLAAVDSAFTLSTHLAKWCLDPGVKLGEIGHSLGSDKIPGLLDLLEEMDRRNRQSSLESVAQTTVCQKVFESLDYTLETHCLTLIDGQSRTGKTASGEAWCKANPGRARLVKVPSTGDDIGFFRRIAEALGGSSALSLKGVQLRERVEKSLQSARLMLVFDEAHNLLPQANRREALPARINWIRTALVDHGVPVALLTTPQFLTDQGVVESKTKWNSQQWVGRIGHFQQLPAKLTDADLELVARKHFPEGSEKAITALWLYAKESTQYTGAIEHVVKRARFEAKRAGKAQAGFDDIARVIKCSGLPSDLMLRDALQGKSKRTSARQPTGAVEPLPLPPARETQPPDLALP